MNTSNLGIWGGAGHLGFLEKKERGDRVMVFFAPQSGRDEQVSGGPFGTPGHGSASESCPVYPLRMGPQQPWLPAGAWRKTALFFNPYWASGVGCW